MALTVTYIFILKLSMHTHTFSACCTYYVYQQLINECFAHSPMCVRQMHEVPGLIILVANATFICMYVHATFSCIRQIDQLV